LVVQKRGKEKGKRKEEKKEKKIRKEKEIYEKNADFLSPPPSCIVAPKFSHHLITFGFFWIFSFLIAGFGLLWIIVHR
jgi:hypothetical protein